MRALLWWLLMLVACGDNCAPPPDAPPRPSCMSLGCPSALCNSAGDCVCHGVPCHG